MKEILRKSAGLVIYAGIGAVFGLLLNALIMYSPLPGIFPAYSESISGRMFSVDFITGIFLFCILSPVVEEFLFRRVLYDLLYRYSGFPAASLISSFVFGAYHMNMIQGVYGFIMGMIFCALYRRDHRIAVPIALHIGANLAVWIFSNWLNIRAAG